MPPDMFAVSVIDWPVSIEGLSGVGLPADSTGLTFTMVLPEVRVGGFADESDTV